jgi:hypothetical protein
MALNRTLLELRFQEATGCTAAKAQKHTQNYIRLCALEIIHDNFTSQAGAGYYINQTQLQDTLNTVMVQGQRFYVWQTFQSFPERIFEIRQTGSNLNRELSLAQARYTLEDIVLASGNPDELAAAVYAPFEQEIAHEEYDLVPVDMRSLSNYIKSNLSNDRDSARMSAELSEELDRNLKHAQKIHMLAQAADNQLMQIRNESAFGRRYYKGPNLQNTPKRVRHAALGDCHEYDIESSVFAWKLSWFREICRAHNTSISMPATLEYLDHKRALRRRLARAVFDTEADWAVKTIKEFVTAIGFGAPLRGVGYVADGQYQKPALAQIITAKTRLDRALADPWVQQFVQEQSDMNAAIFALARVTLIDELRTVPELWEKGARKLKPNSVISYLYQHAEREILDWAEQFCEDRQVLLTVHDCIYTRQPVKLSEFREGLLAFGEFFRLEHQQHRAYTWEDSVMPTDPFYDPREQLVAQRNHIYTASGAADHWNGSGYNGTQEYDPELDPYLSSD